MDSGVQSNYDAQFGKYTLIAKLATGGMGEIFLAKLSGLAGFEKLVVIKRLLPHLAEDSHFVTMLLDEARIVARLSHPNVCQVYDLGEVDGVFYIAMEYLEGVPCSQLLKTARHEEQLLDIRLAANLMQQTCAGLHHAHSLKDGRGNDIGLVHRDVSPSNLFATISGTLKVLDFGVAKSQDAHARTHTGALKGKYAYMSPEQVLANDVDRRSDVFSLGIVYFELLTTRRLFWRDSEYKMFQAIAEEPIPDVRDFRPDVPAEVAEIVSAALSRSPSARYETAEAMGEAVGAAMALSSGVAPNSTVADYVRSRFDGQIRERRELLVTAVGPHNQPTVADGRADMGEHSRELAFVDAPEIHIERSPENLENLLGDLAAEEKKRDSRGIGFYAALAAIGVIAAIAASFVLGMISDRRETRRNEGVIDSPFDDDAAVVATAPTADANPDEPRPADAGPAKSGKIELKFSVGDSEFAKHFVRENRSSIEKCIERSPPATDVEVTIQLLLERDGTISSSSATGQISSSLRTCLTRLARKTKFWKSETRGTLKVPLTIAPPR